MISIVVPTITGREHWLERCVEAYHKTLQDIPDYQIIVIKDWSF